jgi:protein-S-isoprenylcysteine O-methyltransferase Ste14
MGLLSVSLFLLMSVAAAAASVHAWRARQTYGLSHFLAFECLAALIVRNLDRWFQEPFSFPQVVSWITFVTAMVLAAHGLHLLRTVGRARARIMEDTQTVVAAGAYRYIRHPLYTSLVLFDWGVFLKGLDGTSAALASAATTFWVLTARQEERFNVDRFGTAYSEYMKRTKMFVPFLV